MVGGILATRRCHQVTAPEWWKRACNELCIGDPLLAAIIGRFPEEQLEPRADAFFTLARAITGQQISVKAAQSVWNRLEVICDGEVTVEAVLARSMEQLRPAGLSQRKAEYVYGLASHREVWDIDWEPLDDETTIARLCQLRGVGRWTAKMFLIFHLLRPDVLPLDDMGLVAAMRGVYGEALETVELREIGAVWQPWRSVATWYLWRSLTQSQSNTR